MKFTKGQKLTVSATQATVGLRAGTYVFAKYSDSGYVELESNRHGCAGGWYARRFAAAPVKASAPKGSVATVRRAANGRFVGQPVERPVVLRRGAIYSVKRKRGVSLAKYVATVPSKRGEYIALVVHGYPFLTKKENVRFANKQEVASYLAQAKAFSANK